MLESSITDWIIAIGTLITTSTMGVLIWAILLQRKQLLVSNYEVLTNYIGAEKTRHARRILYTHYESPISKSFFEKFPNQENNLDFDDYNEWARYIGAIYLRVSFLIKQDRKIQEKIIDHHGYTLGITWIMFQPFMEMWKKSDKIKEYSEFKDIGDLCYCEWKDKINEFLAGKKEQNKNRNEFKWFLKDKKTPFEW